MKSAYIITDKTETELSLVSVLPAAFLEDIQIITSSTRSGAISSLLWTTSAETTYKIFLSPKTQNLTDRDNPIVHDLIQFLSAYIQQPV
jgi:hypothetical protein